MAHREIRRKQRSYGNMTLLQRSQTIPPAYGRPMLVRGPPFPFLELPLELRWIVYNYYILDHCTLTPGQIHETVLPKSHRPRPPLLSLVCRSVKEEMLDQYRRLKVVPTIRLSWQDRQFDELTKLHLHSLQIHSRVDFEDLRIQIYAPHPDRPLDILQIMRNTLRLCRDLEWYRVQHLTVVFLDTEIADWAREPDPLKLEYFESRTHLYRKGCSFLHVLNLLASHPRVRELQFVLPPSLVGDRELETMARQRPYRTGLSMFNNLLPLREDTLKARTGKKSWDKFNELTEPEWGKKVFAHELEEFQAVWPQMESWPCKVPERLVSIHVNKAVIPRHGN
ncbi:hypothetical protein MMC18_009532 [Xylographa bjoerkii]|nr:hypothetical protein [Xylographa bjoerkii]